MGLPVVATDVRGCRQVVDDPGSGRLVEVGDVAALAEAIATLVDDPALRARTGQAAHLKASTEFDQQRVIETTLGVYDSLLGKSSRPRAREA